MYFQSAPLLKAIFNMIHGYRGKATNRAVGMKAGILHLGTTSGMNRQIFICGYRWRQYFKPDQDGHHILVKAVRVASTIITISYLLEKENLK